MLDISFIEKKCEQLNLKLPALNQLKAAHKRKDFEAFNRIASNIVSFLNENYKISQFPQRPSSPP